MNDPTPAQRAAQIALDLEALYRAGKVDFPDKAEELSGYAKALSGALTRANTQASKASDITSLIFNDLRDTHYMLYEALRRSVVTMNDCAEGCVAVANMFAATDDQAAQAMNSLSSELPGIVNAPTPQAPEPPVRPDPVP